MAGRRPKPTHLKLIAGNPGRRPLNSAEPRPHREIPSPPAHLTSRGKVAWGYVSAQLDRLGVLTEADAWALEQMCETYAELVELRSDVAANGRFQTVKTKDGAGMERMRPAYAAMMDADRRFRAWLVEFGKTPAARAKVKSDEGEKDQDPAAAYFV